MIITNSLSLNRALKPHALNTLELRSSHKRTYLQLGINKKPCSEKRGGLNGSTQHLLKVFF